MVDLEQFYDEYVDKVYKYFYIQSLNKHTAEDLTSQTFIAFIDKQSSNAINDAKKYLYAIMRNVWVDYLRAKYKEAVDSFESIEDFEAHTEESTQAYELMDIRKRALQYIDKLPEAQREILTMRLIEGEKVRTIANKLNRSISYVKTTQYRGVKSLKRMLEQPETGGQL